MHIHPRNESTNRYPLYKQIFLDSANQRVLDYGGNRGNLLFFSNFEIEESLYTSIDVSTASIEIGKEEFPSAKWYHFDKWNWAYHHEGQKNIPFPDINKQQDYIWAYSVFSHTDFAEFLEAIKWFMTFDYKKIALSFLDADGYDMKEWFRRRRVDEFGSSVNLPEVYTDDIFYFTNNDNIIRSLHAVEKYPYSHFLAFYKVDWLLSKLQEENIIATIERPEPGYVPFLVITSDNNR